MPASSMLLRLKIACIIICCVATAADAAAAATPALPPQVNFSPTGLRVSGAEHSSQGNTRGGFVDSSRSLEFRWALSCPGCLAVTQSFYQVTVHEKARGGSSTSAPSTVFDTGKVRAAALRHLSPHAGRLQSNTEYTMELRVWAAVGVPPGGNAEEGHANSSVPLASAATTASSFRTALLRQEDWAGAAWIGGGTQLRTEFQLPAGKTVASANAFVSGAGCFALTVNGKKVTEAFLEPSWANLPPARMLYRAYDVKPLLEASPAQALGLRLGMCKYGYLGAFCDNAHGANGNCKAAIVQLAVKYTDGSAQNVSSTAATWMQTTAANPIRFSHLFHGEIYDARMEQRGWDKPGFKPSAEWKPAIAYSRAGEDSPGRVCR
jgi:alpha-L-rhamnosidase